MFEDQGGKEQFLRYAPPAPGSENYVQEASRPMVAVAGFGACGGVVAVQGRWGPLGDARQCRDSRKARLEAYVRQGLAFSRSNWVPQERLGTVLGRGGQAAYRFRPVSCSTLGSDITSLRKTPWVDAIVSSAHTSGLDT